MSDDLTKAITELKQENSEYTCVLCRGDDVYTAVHRGVKPLIEWIDCGADFKDFSAADKVVGKAAAFLYVLLGVSEVYALVMSEAAVDTLAKNGIVSKYEKSVPHIINRNGDGMCPMEQSVWDIDDPAEALDAIRKRLAELSQN